MSATWKGRKGLNLAHEATKKLGDVGRPLDREPPPITLAKVGFQDRRFPNEMNWPREVLPSRVSE